MRTSRFIAAAGGLLVAVLLVAAHAESPEELRTRIWTQTKFNLVTAESLTVPLSQYKGDGDPTTLEVVIFRKKSDGPSRVSDDGEVIFFYEKDSDKLQQQLIQRAFEIRIAKAVSGT
jgi:hypothetical protein